MRWRSAARAAATMLLRVPRIAGERLFDQHVFATRERGRAPLEVGRRRQGDIHQVDVVAGDQLRITTEGHGNRVLRGEVLRAFESSRRDGDHFRAEQRVGRSHDAAWRDPCRAQYADAYHGRQSRTTARCAAAHCRAEM